MAGPAQKRLTGAGLSIIELTVAVSVLSVGALAAVTMQRTSVIQNGDAFAVQEAVALAEQLHERARGLSYRDSRLAQTSGFVAPPSSLSPSSPLAADGSAASNGYTRTWQILTDVPVANVKTIQVRVAWSLRGPGRSITVATLRAK